MKEPFVNRAVYVVAKTTGEAEAAIKRDEALNRKRHPNLDLRILGDGEWYRLAGLRNFQLLIVPGWEGRKDAEKLRPYLREPTAILLHPVPPSPRKPHVSTED